MQQSLLITLALLQLRLKQYCQSQQEEWNKKQETARNQPQKEQVKQAMEQNIGYFGYDPAKFIKNISNNFYQRWKISKNLLLVIKNSLSKMLDYELINRIANE